MKTGLNITCDHCDRPAVHAVQDLREIPQAEHGQWAKFERDGQVHKLCDDHHRRSRTTYIDGGDGGQAESLKTLALFQAGVPASDHPPREPRVAWPAWPKIAPLPE